MARLLGIVALMAGCVSGGEGAAAVVEVGSPDTRLGGFAPDPASDGISLVTETGAVLAAGKGSVYVTFPDDADLRLRLEPLQAGGIRVEVRGQRCGWTTDSNATGYAFAWYYLRNPGNATTLTFDEGECTGMITLRWVR